MADYGPLCFAVVSAPKALVPVASTGILASPSGRVQGVADEGPVCFAVVSAPEALRLWVLQAFWFSKWLRVEHGRL